MLDTQSKSIPALIKPSLPFMPAPSNGQSTQISCQYPDLTMLRPDWLACAKNALWLLAAAALLYYFA